MPIVFEEVTTDIALPPRPPEPAQPSQPQPPAPDAMVTLRQQLALLAERQARLQAD